MKTWEQYQLEIKCLKEEVGYSLAFERFFKAGLNPSMIQKILAGSYPNKPKTEYLVRIDKALR